MDKAEAAKILGVTIDSPEKDINDAYRYSAILRYADIEITLES